MRYYIAVAGHVLEAEVDGGAVVMDGTGEVARLAPEREGPAMSLLVGNCPRRVHALRRADATWTIHYRGRSFEVEVADERAWRIPQAGGVGSPVAGREPLRAPMPGLVLRVDVEEGQEVAEGQGLLIVEAMKMENELRARASGRIRRLHVVAGASVKRGDVLIEFEQDDAPQDEGGGR